MPKYEKKSLRKLWMDKLFPSDMEKARKEAIEAEAAKKIAAAEAKTADIQAWRLARERKDKAATKAAAKKLADARKELRRRYLRP